MCVCVSTRRAVSSGCVADSGRANDRNLGQRERVRAGFIRSEVIHMNYTQRTGVAAAAASCCVCGSV